MSYSKSSVSDTCDGTAQASAQPKDTIERRRINRQMVQDVCLIWLDTNIDENSIDYRSIIAQLRCVVNSINTFTDADECIRFLTDLENENVCMIISNVLCQSIISSIHDVPQLQTIFILCENKATLQSWADSWFKIKGFFIDVSSLCKDLQQVARQCERNAIPMSFIPLDGDVSKKNLDELSPSFMYTQILKEILLSIKFDQDHMKQFIQYCCEKFAGNEAEVYKIKEFECRYYDRTPIWWYTYEGFLYRMLNRALRIMDTDTIIKMGFFIQDLYQHLERLHKMQISQEHSDHCFTVYRGQGMSHVEFEHITKNKSGLLAFNSFLSTSYDRDVAFLLAESNSSNPQLIGILFVIAIDPLRSTTPFASINDVSHFREEKEVLFSMQTVFRIGDIISLSESSRLYQVELRLTIDKDEDLNQLTEYIRRETYSDKSGWIRLALVLYKIGQFQKSEEVYQILLEQTADESEKASIYNRMGVAKVEQGQYIEAITFYEKALENRQQSLSANHPDLAACYNNIGNVYSYMSEYFKARSYYEKALEIQQQSLPPNHPNLAISYANIGGLYYNMGEYSEALSSQEKALQIQQQSLPPNHPDLAKSYNNIGLVYYNMGEYFKSLSSQEKALEIRQQSLPPNHPDLAAFYNNIGLVYDNMGEYSNALSSHEKALEIQQQSLPPNHPDLARSYINIGHMYQNMDEHSKGLSYYEKAMEIQQQSLPSYHPDLAKSYNNIGSVYRHMGEYSKALSYFEKTLEIQQQSLPPNHPDLFLSYNNIGLVYYNTNEYSNALAYYEKSLEIIQQSLPSKHSGSAATYGNIGLLYEQMDDLSKAYLFFAQACEIADDFLPPNHPIREGHKHNLDRIKNKL